MVTTKNSGAVRLALLASVSWLCWAGCAPPGARALLEGDRLTRAGKYAQAVEKLKLATQLLPPESQARAWNHLGLAYHLSGRPDEAVTAYRQALQRNPNLAVARYNLGNLYLEHNKLPEAVSEFTSYRILDRQSHAGWLKLATAQLRSRLWDDAEQSFTNSLQLQAGSVEALNGLAVAQAQKKRIREAAHSLNLALQRQPNYAPALLNSGILNQYHLHDRPAALQKYRAYLALKPTPVYANAVQSLVRQIELEINPPPRVVLTNQPAPLRPAPPTLATVTNSIPSPISVKTAVPPVLLAATNPSPTQVKTSPPPALTAIVVKPSAQTNFVKPGPPAAASPAKTSAPPVIVKIEPKPLPKAEEPPKVEPPPPVRTTQASPTPTNSTPAIPSTAPPQPVEKIEVVELKSEPPPKLAADVTPPPPLSTPTNAVAVAVVPDPLPRLTPPPVNAPAEELFPGPIVRKTPPEPRRGIVQRLNPLSWFRGKEKSASVEPPSHSEAKAEPTSSAPSPTLTPPPAAATPPPPEPERVTIPRYAYRSLAKPSSGDKAKAGKVFSEGLTAHQERRLTAAIEAYREAVRLDPSSYEACYNLGLATYEVKDFAASLAAYEAALAIDPGSVDARYNFSLALQRANFLLDAADELSRLLANQPNNANAHFSLGKLYAERLARLDLARTHYRKVLELQPRHPQAATIRYWLAAHP